LRHSAHARTDGLPIWAIRVNNRVTKDLFEELAADEEGHIDFLETQLELIKQVGLQLYAQKHVGGLEGDEH
jgi:bacterioferritin